MFSSPYARLARLTIVLSALFLAFLSVESESAEGNAGEFLVASVRVPGVVVVGFPVLVNATITNNSTHRLPVKLFDLAHGGGYSDFCFEFRRGGETVAEFHRPPIQGLVGPREAILEDPAETVWLKPGESIEMWFDLAQATYLDSPRTNGVFLQAEPEIPLGEFSLVLSFGKTIGAIDAGLITTRAPTSDERSYLNLVKQQVGEKNLFVRTFVRENVEIPSPAELPEETGDLMSLIVRLKECVHCGMGEGNPGSGTSAKSSSIYRRFEELIRFECDCPGVQYGSWTPTDFIIDDAVRKSLTKQGGPVSSLRKQLE